MLERLVHFLGLPMHVEDRHVLFIQVIEDLPNLEACVHTLFSCI
jgi:hypothetical protein